MKIVQIEDFFHPDAGYQVNILSKYLVSAGHEVYILTAVIDEKIPNELSSFFDCENIDKKDKEFEKKNGVNITRIPLAGYWGNRYVYSKKIFGVIKELNPDVLYVHGNDTYIGVVVLGNVQRFRCAVISDSHMLEFASVNPLHKVFCAVYRKIITPKIIKNHISVIRTTNDPYVYSNLGIPLKQCPFISFGSDTMLFHRDVSVRKKFREKNGISDDAFVVVYAGKLDEGKGGEFLADSLMDRFDISREIVFVIVGNTIGDYGKLVEGKLSKSANDIRRFPTQTYNSLATFFQMADIALFPKQCSLSYFDAQACGLPVVFEDNSINLERSKWGTSLVFKAGDIVDFRNRILQYAEMDKDRITEIGNKAIEHIQTEYDYADTAKRYLNVIEQAYESYERKSKK